MNKKYLLILVSFFLVKYILFYCMLFTFFEVLHSLPQKILFFILLGVFITSEFYAIKYFYKIFYHINDKMNNIPFLISSLIMIIDIILWLFILFVLYLDAFDVGNYFQFK